MRAGTYIKWLLQRELRMTIGYVVFLLPISGVAGLCRQSLPTVVYTKEYSHKYTVTHPPQHLPRLTKGFTVTFGLYLL
jgi:hypothetical protein